MAIATMGVTVLDCPDPRALAEFYAGVLGWSVDEQESEPDEGWVEVAGPGGRLAFQESPGYRPPEWPGVEHGQQFHLDFFVPRERLDEAEQEVVGLGAKLVQTDDADRKWRVYLDPVGHPFCLCPQ